MISDDQEEGENIMRIGLITDIHGDYEGFRHALEIFQQHNVKRILCMGDVADRGADADKIIRVLRHHDILTIAGNHDRTIVQHQARWRATPPEKHARLRELGRIISDDSARYLENLPDTATLRIASTHILIAHGAPWSDATTIFPTVRDAVLQRMINAHPRTQVFLLGHTHQPMVLHYHDKYDEANRIRYVINPGSVYGITARDSHSCAILSLPDCHVEFFDVQTGDTLDIPITERWL